MILDTLHDVNRNILGSKENLIGVTSGCFDILHPTQVLYLQRCRRECTDLIVLIDSDELMYKNKGKYPVFNEMDRAFMVDSLECVSHVLIMDSLDILKLTLSSIKFNYKTTLFRNGNKVYGTDVIETPGVELRIIPDIKRLQSTTEIINHIKNK